MPQASPFITMTAAKDPDNPVQVSNMAEINCYDVVSQLAAYPGVQLLAACVSKTDSGLVSGFLLFSSVREALGIYSKIRGWEKVTF